MDRVRRRVKHVKVRVVACCKPLGGVVTRMSVRARGFVCNDASVDEN